MLKSSRPQRVFDQAARGLEFVDTVLGAEELHAHAVTGAEHVVGRHGAGHDRFEAIVVGIEKVVTERLERIELPGLEIQVIGEVAPVEDDPEALPVEVEERPDLLRTVLLAIPILGFAIWLGPRLWRRLSAWRAAFLGLITLTR